MYFYFVFFANTRALRIFMAFPGFFPRRDDHILGIPAIKCNISTRISVFLSLIRLKCSNFRIFYPFLKLLIPTPLVFPHENHAKQRRDAVILSRRFSYIQKKKKSTAVFKFSEKLRGYDSFRRFYERYGT